MKKKLIWLTTAMVLMALGLLATTAFASDSGTHLYSATVEFDYELDGSFGNGQGFVYPTVTYDKQVVYTFGAETYGNRAENGVTWLIGVGGRGACEKGDPIVAMDVSIVITDFPAGTEFPNAHRFAENGDPIYKFGVVKCTETADNYRVIQMTRPNESPFTIGFQVFGSTD